MITKIVHENLVIIIAAYKMIFNKTLKKCWFENCDSVDIQQNSKENLVWNV